MCIKQPSLTVRLNNNYTLHTLQKETLKMEHIIMYLVDFCIEMMT